MPREVKAVGLAGHRQSKGERVMIHHVVSHVVELCIQACVRTEDKNVPLTEILKF